MRLSSLSTVSAIGLACTFAHPAIAQDSSPATGSATEVEDIIVTGTRRDTRFQDADVSVTVLDRKTLDEARIRDVRQLDAAVPNVHFNESGQVGSTFISIRGIESNPFIVNRAAIYIDGIPFRELSNAVLNQVESIEVMRGPQATLYGANSESGLIVISTRAPTDELIAEGRATGAAFRNGLSGVVDGFVGGPLDGDRLAGSIAFKAASGGSYLRNIQPGSPDGSLRELFLQGRLRWRPIDELTVNGTFYVLDKRAPGIFDQQYLPRDVELYNRTYANSFNRGRQIGRFSYIEDAPKLTTQREVVGGVSAGYDLGYGRIDAALSYRRFISDAKGLDFDFTALPTAAGQDAKTKDFYNVELRFTSPASSPFNYIIGVTHYREDNDRYQTTFVGPGNLDSYIPAPHQYSHARDWGAFVSANWSPTFLPKLTFSAGIRYDHAHRSAKQNAGQIDLGGGNIFIYRDAELSGDFHAVLPRFSIRFEPSRQLTFYASAAKGYVPGGFNLAAAQNGLPDDVLRYASETMWSSEGGFKWRSADGRVRIAGAGFYIRSNNWQEIQVATDAAGRIISADYIGASASIDSKGFELELSVQPAAGLSFIANLGYVDARYRDLQVDATTNVRGRRVKLVPTYDGYFAARYQTPSGLFARAELALTGKESLESRGEAVQPATQTVGLQLGYEGPRWSIRAFVENLTDVRRASGLAFRNLGFGNDGNWYAPVSRGRQFGIELQWNL